MVLEINFGCERVKQSYLLVSFFDLIDGRLQSSPSACS
jgi:hypothetical protein